MARKYRIRKDIVKQDKRQQVKDKRNRMEQNTTRQNCKVIQEETPLDGTVQVKTRPDNTQKKTRKKPLQDQKRHEKRNQEKTKKKTRQDRTI